MLRDELKTLLLERWFEPHPLLKGNHAQTLAGWAWPRRFQWRPPRIWLTDEARIFEVEPDVRLLARCHWQEDRLSRPTLLLVHGLEGSADSASVIGTAELAYREGMNVIRLNQRNCGGTEHLTPTLYHSGMSGDLRAVVEELLGKDGLPGICVAGLSMGGNLALKMAAEMGTDAPPGLSGVCAVCPPIDLSMTARCIDRPANRLYQTWFVRGLRHLMLRKNRLYPDLYDVRNIDRVHTVRQFDELYTAPHGGFADAEDYYANSSSLGYLPQVNRPALVIHAKDDPLVPYAPWLRPVAQSNPMVYVAAPDRGGHVGFVARQNNRQRFWVEEMIVRYAALLHSNVNTKQ